MTHVFIGMRCKIKKTRGRLGLQLQKLINQLRRKALHQAVQDHSRQLQSIRVVRLYMLSVYFLSTGEVCRHESSLGIFQGLSQVFASDKFSKRPGKHHLPLAAPSSCKSRHRASSKERAAIWTCTCNEHQVVLDQFRELCAPKAAAKVTTKTPRPRLPRKAGQAGSSESRVNLTPAPLGFPSTPPLKDLARSTSLAAMETTV